MAVLQIWDDDQFGTGIVGTLYDNGDLILSGSGEVFDFSSTTSPVSGDSRVVTLIVEEGITYVGDHIVRNCSNLTTVTPFPE